MPLLEVCGLSRRFRGLHALEQVDFVVEAGEIVALIGPNGAGKTTCFNLISGALRPDTGSIRLNGQAIHGLTPDRICRAGVGRTFQIVRPFAGMSVLDNVMVGALVRERRLAPARRLAQELLDQLGLGGRGEDLASSLTLSERKRLEVARALASRPSLLLLDEMMAGLRPAEIDVMVAMLGGLRRDTGIAVLLIEHVIRAVLALADRIVVLHHGQLIASGPPDKVMADQRVRDSYLGAEGVA